MISASCPASANSARKRIGRFGRADVRRRGRAALDAAAASVWHLGAKTLSVCIRPVAGKTCGRGADAHDDFAAENFFVRCSGLLPRVAVRHGRAENTFGAVAARAACAARVGRDGAVSPISARPARSTAFAWRRSATKFICDAFAAQFAECVAGQTKPCVTPRQLWNLSPQPTQVSFFADCGAFRFFDHIRAAISPALAISNARLLPSNFQMALHSDLVLFFKLLKAPSSACPPSSSRHTGHPTKSTSADCPPVSRCNTSSRHGWDKFSSKYFELDPVFPAAPPGKGLSAQ